ncbi:MAG: hypothetical protein V4714_16590 [Bacteroidota bacterium]
MKKDQEAKRKMYTSTDRYLLTNDTVVKDLPNYAPTIEAYRQALQQIGLQQQIQELGKEGFSKQKEQKHLGLVRLTMDAVAKLKAYATFEQKLVLLKEIDFTESELKQAADNLILSRAKIVLDRAKANLAGLAPYLLTQAQVDALSQAITDFEAVISDPRMGIIDRKNATQALEDLFAQADSLLKDKLDVLAALLRDSNPSFHQGYLNARIIVDAATRSPKDDPTTTDKKE